MNNNRKRNNMRISEPDLKYANGGATDGETGRIYLEDPRLAMHAMEEVNAIETGFAATNEILNTAANVGQQALQLKMMKARLGK